LSGGGTHLKLYKGIIDSFKTISKKEGIKGFYKGMTPSLMKIVPASAV
jgi:hypothetical protein